MISRKQVINLHLILAALFMPLLLMMPLTGSLYILGYQGDQVKTKVFSVNASIPSDENEKEVFFREQFLKNEVDYKFEYIRSSKTEFIFRPTTRVHYVATQIETNQYDVFRVEPTMLKRLIELHKGHGPRAMRWFEVAFGIALILTTLSGLWLAWTVKSYRTITLVSFSIGVLVIFTCLI